MSGLFISTGKQNQDVTAALRALSFTRDTWRTDIRFNDLVVGVTRVDPSEFWGPAQDPATGVYVALGGRLAFEEEDWKRAERLPYEGGLACRLVLDQWLQRGEAMFSTLNGAGCVVIVEKREGRLHVVTDRMGAFPLYFAQGRQLILCSHPDVLADALQNGGESVKIDWVAIAECLGMSSAVHPYTYHQPVRQLDAATHYRWSFASSPRLEKQTIYWEPAYLKELPRESSAQLVDELAEAFTRAVKRRTNPRLGKTALMLSGGADSRVALFGACDPAQVINFSVFDEPNEELHTAKRLAAIVGARHVELQRSHDYYADSAQEAVRISGGMWSLSDAHFLGFTEAIQNHQPGTVLTGCYADYLFKGITFNRTPRKVLGRNVPLYDFSPFKHAFYHGSTVLSEAWQERVARRWEEHIPSQLQVSYPDSALKVEDLRLRPLIREVNAAGRLALWRLLPWDVLFCDRDVLDVYGRMPAHSKLNGIVFGRAVGKIIGAKGRKVFNNNYYAPVGATESQRAAYFIAASLKRKVQSLPPFRPSRTAGVTSGSWPEWSVYVGQSPQIGRLFADPVAGEKERFREILGFDPWSLTQEEWARRDVMLFMRFLTVRVWLMQRKVFG